MRNLGKTVKSFTKLKCAADFQIFNNRLYKVSEYGGESDNEVHTVEYSNRY
jgi:hypothetical protein